MNKRTPPEQPPAVELVILAHNGECHELLVIQLLRNRSRIPQSVKVDEKDSIGQGVDNEGVERFLMLVTDKCQYQAEKLEAQPVSCFSRQWEAPSYVVQARASIA